MNGRRANLRSGMIQRNHVLTRTERRGHQAAWHDDGPRPAHEAVGSPVMACASLKEQSV
jgi:hypothetical protein